jgi:hypothetical protein
MGNERELLQYSNMTFARRDAGNMKLRDLLGLFWPDDIVHCARELGLPTIGKDEAIERLVELASLPGLETNWAVLGLVGAFSEEGLRRICGPLTSDKPGMVRTLTKPGGLGRLADLRASADGGLRTLRFVRAV